VLGYGDVGKGCAQAFPRHGRHHLGDRDRSDLRTAGGDGRLPRRDAWTRPASQGDIFVTTTGNVNVINHGHMKAMKNEAIVCNIGHFDSEIEISALEQYSGKRSSRRSIHVIFPDGKKIIVLAKGRLVNLGAPPAIRAS